VKRFAEPTVAVVGATGAVGRTIQSILSERNFPLSRLRLLASERSAGTVVDTPWGDVTVEDLAGADPAGIDIAIFSAGGGRSREYAPRFVAAGATVIDNSSAFRMDDDVPLVVAEVNDGAIESHNGIIANPNCTTMALMMAAGPLHRAAGIDRMVAMSYQATSGSGQQGMDTLQRQIDALGADRDALQHGGWVDPGGDLYQRPIGYNVLPMAGAITDAGHTDEEWKLVNETRKILEAPGIRVEPTCVRVPTMVGHGIAATMFFDRPMTRDEAVAVLSEAPGAQVWPDDHVPTPLDSAGVDDVLIGRIRETIGDPGGISLWAVGDNLRKGAALNTVQLAELLLDEYARIVRRGAWSSFVIACMLATLMIAACSHAVEIPPELRGMTADEVGCKILYGPDATVVGPLGPSDGAVVEPNEWTSFRIWRTALDLGFSIRTQWTASDISMPVGDLPDDHVVAQQEMRDTANPGYRITCWRGGG